MKGAFLSYLIFQIEDNDEQKMLADLYTFDANVSEATKTYEAVCVAYERLFRTLGIGAIRGALFLRHHHISRVRFRFCSTAYEWRVICCARSGGQHRRYGRPQIARVPFAVRRRRGHALQVRALRRRLEPRAPRR